MKNTYYVIKTDGMRSCASVKSTFTNKASAIKECTRLRQQVKAANGLRACEGSHERNPSLYFVTNTNAFIESTGYSGGFQKVPKEAIIH